MRHPLVRFVLIIVLAMFLALPALAALPSQTVLRHPLANNLTDGAPDDNFGHALAVDGNTAIVGVPGDGVGSVRHAGAVYVYEFSAGQWLLRTKLVAPSPAVAANFGQSVDLDGDTLIVGAPRALIGGIAIGSAFVFRRSGSTWSLQASLLPSDPTRSQAFGDAVGVDGDLAVVGIPGFQMAVGQNGGAAEVFTRSGTVWTARDLLVDPEASGRFGAAVSVSADRFAVGAPNHAVGGNTNVGHVRIYQKPTAISLVLEATVAASNGASGDLFGGALSLSGTELAIGANGRDQGMLSNVGAAYVFSRNPDATWAERTMLQASTMLQNQSFGSALDLRPGLLLVGAPGDSTPADDGFGQAFAFSGSASTWIKRSNLVPAPISNSHRGVGSSVAITSSGSLIGAEYGVIGTATGQGLVVPFLGGPDSWTRQSDLFLPTGPQYAHLGSALAVSPDGNIVAVGAPEGRRLASDPLASGVVFVYRRDFQTGWNLEATLVSPNMQTNGSFGYGLALSNTELVVGAPNEAGLVFANQGIAYVYRFDGNAWALNASLTAPSPSNDLAFGIAVSLDFNQMAVSAPAEANANVAGAVHIFKTNAGVWQWLTSKSEAGLPYGANYGASVAIEGTLLAVGIPGKTSGGVSQRGEVAVYTQQNANWATTTVANYSILDTTLDAVDAGFGSSLALRYPYLLVGAPDYGVHGAAFGFEASGAFFNNVLDFKPTLPCCNPAVGTSVAIAGSDLLIGAPYADEGGNEPIDGVVYVFERGALFPWEFRMAITRSVLGEGVVLGQTVAGSYYDYVMGAPYTSGLGIHGNPEEGAVLIQDRELMFTTSFE